MSAQSQLNRTLIFLCLTFLPAWANSEPSNNADAELIYGRYHTTENNHGLYEIWQAADGFIVDYNLKYKSNFRAIGPDLRIMVPKCMVSLNVEWNLRARGDQGKGVNVSCKRTLDANQKQWKVFVPVYVPRS